jgi:hypothetical protein
LCFSVCSVIGEVYARDPADLSSAAAEGAQAARQQHLAVGSVDELVRNISKALPSGTVPSCFRSIPQSFSIAHTNRCDSCSGGYILSSLRGDRARQLFRALTARGMTPSRGWRVLALGVDQREALSIGREFLAGHYGVWSYAQHANDTEMNALFVEWYQSRTGSSANIT